MKIAIGIPIYINVVAHLDYLNQTTNSLHTSHAYIFIPVINRYSFERKPWNFTQTPEQVLEIEGRQPQAVSKAWNDIITKGIAEGCEYILVLNQDVILAKDAIDNLVAFAEANKDNNVMWTMAEHKPLETLDVQTGGEAGLGPHFSAYMVDKTFQDTIGKFDENIQPAYFEDNDMHARIVKSGKHALSLPNARFFHHGSVTLKKDPELQIGHGARFNANKDYFIRKWGHEVVGTEDDIASAYYKTPFNDPDKDINSW